MIVPDLLTTADVAARAGIKPGSVRRYVTRGDMPPPDRHIGRTPVWLSETIEAWLASRPGRIGRPRKRAQSAAR